MATAEACVWAQARFLSDGVINWSLVAAVAVVSLLAFGADWSTRTRFAGLPRWLGILGIAGMVGLSGGHPGWTKVAAGVVSLGFALSIMRQLLLVSTARRSLTPADGLRGALLQVAAAWALYPYVVSGLVGSGDAYHYGLMIADMIGQLRAHVFPVFVGQTEFGLNGNIHTLRTAPFYVHFGAVLDLATFHLLPIFALQHLVLLATAVLGTVGAYAALRRFRPEEPWICAGLALLYLFCPGVLAPLYEGDMIATFMAVSMLPWLILGLAQAAEQPRAWKPWFIQACALGGLWWAHPPVGFWCTLVVLGHWLGFLLIPGRAGVTLLRMGAATVVFGLVAGYVFVSVYSLKLRPPEGIDGAGYAPAIVANLQAALPAAFEPIGGLASGALSDIQLGYSLLACLGAGLLAVRRSTAIRFLLGATLVLLVLLVPIPHLTAHLWDLVPGPVLSVTNVWPMQRLYLVLAGLAIFLGAAGLERLASGGPIRRGAALAVLALGTVWSGLEAHKFFARATATTTTAAAAAQSLQPENLKLTRSSYLVFNFTPPYFSHAPIDAALESRLYDLTTDTFFASGSTPVGPTPAPDSASIDLVQNVPDWNLGATLTIPPHERLLLQFDFLNQQPSGTLQFTSPTMLREYLLPSSGESRSFGAGPDNGRLITLPNSGDLPEVVQVQFIPTPAFSADTPRVKRTFAKVSYEPLEARPRMVEIVSLVPYTALLHTARPALLETPRVFLPGYRGRVNGRIVHALQTNDGLVGIFVPAGESRVQIEYPGSLLLRTTYWVGLAGWGLMLAWLLLPPGWDDRLNGALRGHDLERRTLHALRWVGLPLLGSAGLATAVWAANRAAITARHGPIRIECELPLGMLTGAQPLLCTGKTGAADVIFIKFLGGGRVQVGDDHWGKGGPLSAPFKIDWSAPQRIEISTSALLPVPPAGAPPPPVQVRWNGELIFTDPVEAYPTSASDIVVGANPVGSTSCAAAFDGTILDVSQVRPFDH